MSVPYDGGIWTKSYGPDYIKFWAFDKKKTSFLSYFWHSVEDIFGNVSVVKTIVWCLTINFQTTIFQCS